MKKQVEFLELLQIDYKKYPDANMNDKQREEFYNNNPKYKDMCTLYRLRGFLLQDDIGRSCQRNGYPAGYGHQEPDGRSDRISQVIVNSKP